MQHPLTEQNFSPLTSLVASGYTASLEIGDLVQNKQVWHEQALRVTIVDPAGETKWKIFRGAKCRVEATKWLTSMTSSAINSI